MWLLKMSQCLNPFEIKCLQVPTVQTPTTDPQGIVIFIFESYFRLKYTYTLKILLMTVPNKLKFETYFSCPLLDYQRHTKRNTIAHSYVEVMDVDFQ